MSFFVFFRDSLNFFWYKIYNRIVCQLVIIKKIESCNSFVIPENFSLKNSLFEKTKNSGKK